MTADRAGAAEKADTRIPPPAISLDSTAHLDAQVLIASARALRDAHRAQTPQVPLRGKYIALLGTGPESEVSLFQGAATELGARVAHVRIGLTGTSAEKDVQDMAGVLARLYDAVECDGLPAQVVRRLAGAVDVPVFERLASPAHPTARLADLLGPEAAPGENRRFVLQAALVGAMS